MVGCAGSSPLRRLFFSCGEGGLCSSSGASPCSVLSCCRAQALGAWGFGRWRRMGPVAAVRRLQSTGVVDVAHGLICSAAGGIPPDQGLNPCLLCSQEGSLPLSPRRSPMVLLLNFRRGNCSNCKGKLRSELKILLRWRRF